MGSLRRKLRKKRLEVLEGGEKEETTGSFGGRRKGRQGAF
jgi:hypothetical protein